MLNKTNAKKLEAAFGKESAKWVGTHVELYAEMTGLGKEGIRLQPLRSVAKAPPVTPPVAVDDMAEEIPF